LFSSLLVILGINLIYKKTEAVGKNSSCRGKKQYVAREDTDIRQPCLIRVKKAMSADGFSHFGKPYLSVI
jgi:hypothetical protein